MTLTLSDIKSRMNPSLNDVEPIIVTPLLDIEDQIGSTGIDLRLGKQFIVFREHLQGTFKPISSKDVDSKIKKYQEEVVVPIGHSITLHPGKFIIGSTLEYVSIPADLECQVEGRSSWARLGLIIATATTVEPGYKGIITLELSNNGTIPIELHPGLKIANLIFHKTSSPHYTSPVQIQQKKYHVSIGPKFSKISSDKHLEYFCSL